jgi:hypothetical protein
MGREYLMRVAKLVLALVILSALVLPFGAASAQEALTYGSAFQLQNLEDSNATITITFYNQDGGVDATVNDTIAAGSANNYFAVQVEDLPESFTGSAVVSSDREIRAIHNLYANDFTYNASSAGYNAGAPEISLPLVMRGNSGNNTWFNVQNAGPEDAQVQVAYMAGLDGNNYTDPTTYTIAPGASMTFDQTGLTELGDRFVGSAIVRSTNGMPLVASVVQVGPGVLYAYDGFSESSTDIVAPLFQYYNAGNVSSIQIQNAGNAPTTVTVEYTPGFAGNACQETQTIQPGSSGTFGLFSFNAETPGSNCFAQNPGTRFVGSARVLENSGNQPLVGVVNQLNLGQGLASSYSAYRPEEAQSTISLPLLMDRNNGFWTSINLVNIGPATTVTIDYVGRLDRGQGEVFTTSETFSIGAGQPVIRLHAPGGFPIADGWVGSATIRGANPGDQLLAVVNQVRTGGSGDVFQTYNGFGFAP